MKKCFVFLGFCVFVFSTEADFLLHFNDDFKQLLITQEQVFASKTLKDYITSLLQECEQKGQLSEFVVNQISHHTFLKNLGETDDLAKMAHYYLLIQDREIPFKESLCDKIKNVLSQYIQKTLSEYREGLLFMQIGKNSQQDKAKVFEDFLTFFEGYEDHPLQKLDKIFVSMPTTCLIQ